MPAGRPRGTHKITREIVDELVRTASLGMPFKYCCVAAGISMNAVRAWVRNPNESDLHRELSERMKRAKGLFLAANLEVIQKASAREWCASAWLVERCFSEYSSQRHEVARLQKMLADLTARIDALVPPVAEPVDYRTPEGEST
jgi:hypothetical protein